MRHRAAAAVVAAFIFALSASTAAAAAATGRLQRDPRLRAREPDGEPARRQRLVLQALARRTRGR